MSYGDKGRHRLRMMVIIRENPLLFAVWMMEFVQYLTTELLQYWLCECSDLSWKNFTVYAKRPDRTLQFFDINLK